MEGEANNLYCKMTSEIVTEWLVSDSTELEKFQMNVKKYLRTPRQKQLKKSSDILEELQRMGLLHQNKFDVLFELTEGINQDLTNLIRKYEQEIKRSSNRSEDSPDETGNQNKRKASTDDSSRKKTKGEEQSIKYLRDRLIKINNNMTRVIPLSPLMERGDDELPIELLYANVVIHEDQKYKEKGPDYLPSTKVVEKPDDIFKKDGDDVKKIYMIGDAGRGKTTYCLWLLKNWCNAQKDGTEGKELDEWERKMKEFDFVFLLELCEFQNVQTNVASVVDMICQVVFESDTDHHAAIRNVLSSNKYRSMIIIDGLDEWNPIAETEKHRLYNRMPKLDISSTVICFIAMRQWVLSSISKKIKCDDRVIEIFGLNSDGIENVTKNVLMHRYKLKKDPIKCQEECKKIMEYFSEKDLESFMKVPLLTVVCVQMLYEKKNLWGSMTEFYSEMLNMLIERANERHTNLQFVYDNQADHEVPNVLFKNKTIRKCINVLLKFGKIAYEGLLSNETNLLLQKIEIEEQIGERELQFALNVGLISKKEARSITKKNVSVHFFHKSIQEILAAIYIVTNKDVGDSFCKHLSNVDVIMELSNVIMFTCGMCPSLGSVISQHVVSVTDSDTNICRYRESPNPFSYYSIVPELYKVQIKWYRELQTGRTYNPVSFHVSDVYHLWHCDIETIRLTKKLLSDGNVDIRSLMLFNMSGNPHPLITSSELNDFLSNKYNNTGTLESMYITDIYTDKTVDKILAPSMKYLSLDHKRSICLPLLKSMKSLRVLNLHGMTLGSMYGMTSLFSLRLSSTTLGNGGLDLSGLTSLSELKIEHQSFGDHDLNLSDMKSLSKLCLGNVTFRDRGLDLSNLVLLRELNIGFVKFHGRGLDLSVDMAKIKYVKVDNVNMSSAQWKQFIVSLQNIHHSFKINLRNTNIDDEYKKEIEESCNFSVIFQNNVFSFFDFTRLWPPYNEDDYYDDYCNDSPEEGDDDDDENCYDDNDDD